MIPDQVIEYARQQYNAVSDSFFASTEMYRLLWSAQMELAREAWVIERVYTTTTTASQQEYSYPTQTLAIKRITCDGIKLVQTTFREDDSLTLSNQTTTATGKPQYFCIWNETIYLRPVPDSTYTLKIWSYNEPQEVSATSTLEVPTRYHLDLADYLLWRMASKDQNERASERWRQNWEQRVLKAKGDRRRELRGDSFACVQDVDILPVTVIGAL